MKRNYGIDFLRIFAMFLVAIIHVLGQGGVLANVEPFNAKYVIVWTLEAFGYCAVNCFALISGCVMYKSKWKASRMLNLCMQTLFYTILMVFVFLFTAPQFVGKSVLFYIFFPFSSEQYWYISAYFGMLVLVPLLNSILAFTEKKILGISLLMAFLLFCLCPIFTTKDPYSLDRGYSMIWLCLMYLAGGYIHKYDIVEKIKNKWAWLILVGMIVLTCSSRFALIFMSKYIPFLGSYKSVFFSYVSPTVVLLSLSMLVLCSKMKFSATGEKIIGGLTPAVLGVYLFHVNPLVWDHWVKDIATKLPQYNCVVMVCMILLFALIIFVAGILLDLLRIKLFKLLRIDRLGQALDNRLSGTKIGLR